jgi:hypothetical protein
LEVVRVDESLQNADALRSSSIAAAAFRGGVGVVCAVVGSDYALIQPMGTAAREDRIFVPATLLGPSIRRVGQAVTFDATRTSRGLRATTVAVTAATQVAAAAHGIPQRPRPAL